MEIFAENIVIASKQWLLRVESAAVGLARFTMTSLQMLLIL